MRVEESCEKCLYDRRVFLAESIADDKRREQYLARIREIIANRGPDDSAPYLVYLFEQLGKEYELPQGVYPKETYNRIMMDLEHQIEEKIEAASEPLETALVYARIGNYIDFGAMNEVDPEVLMQMLAEKSEEGLDRETYQKFVRDCEGAERFLLLCDNCGEIVADKLLVRQLKKRFPHMHITVMVRGAYVLNDATMEDAVFCGMDREAEVITNGNAAAGTIWELLNDEAKDAIERADVILSKGQGNFETFSDYPGTVYFAFLCKCELFTRRFRVPKMTGMFLRNSDLDSFQ